MNSVFMSRSIGAAILIWVCLWATLTAYLPALPIDETRYLTVAWEMYHAGNFLLPTLNWQPYSHKPPLLFWLIDLAWGVAGPSVQTARIVPLAASVATLLMTVSLAKRMFPQQQKIGTLSGLLLLASPAFMLYGCMIMFDFLLAAFVGLAMIAVWQAYREETFKSWALFGVAVGCGVLTKGPVVLLHVLPVAILFPLCMGRNWNGPFRSKWYWGLVAGLLIAAAIGLAWALPAALYGGPHFTQMIFWEQSAGRVAKSFAHRRPFWFYIPVLLSFIFPLLCWPPFWSGLKKTWRTPRDPATIFLLCWIVPSLIAFSCISGKQPHYLIPILPGMLIIVARFIPDQIKTPWRNLTFLIPVIIAFTVIAAVQFLPYLHGRALASVIASMDGFDPVVISIGLLIAVVAAITLRKTVEGQVLSIILAMGIFIGVFIIEGHKGFLEKHDLQPLADQARNYSGRPLAFAPEYAGEIGFLARRDTPVYVLEAKDLKDWFGRHKNGVAVIRYKDDADIKGLKVLYRDPYRGAGYIAIVQAK